MNLAIVLSGLVILAALAVLIGGGVDARARNAAWRRIAATRRVLDERERSVRRCEHCPLNRFFDRG